MRTCRRQAEGDRCTRSASSALVSRRSRISSRKIARSRSSISSIRIKSLILHKSSNSLPSLGRLVPKIVGHCARFARMWPSSFVQVLSWETKMLVGVPKEIKDNEFRVGLTPSSVAELVHHGHQVLVETSAGVGSGLPDSQYFQAGRTTLATPAEV